MQGKDRKAVIDTSVLLNLAFIGKLSLVEKQFEKVFVPQKVMEEVRKGDRGKDEIERFEQDLLDTVEVERDAFYRELREDLDKGESAVIKYASDNNLDLVLLDESDARSKAKNHGLDVTGVIGVLLAESKRNEEFNLRKKLEELRNHGFWISQELIDEVLKN